VQLVGGSALLYFAEKLLARETHVEHPGSVQQLRAQFLAGLFPHLARALRQRNIAGALGIREPINAGAPEWLPRPCGGNELVEPGNLKPRLDNSTAAKLPMVPRPMMATSYAVIPSVMVKQRRGMSRLRCTLAHRKSRPIEGELHAGTFTSGGCTGAPGALFKRGASGEISCMCPVRVR